MDGINKKKNILVIFTGALELGGIERSLLGLLDSIDYEKYSVDLFLYAHHGTLFPLINENVNLLPEVRELAYLRESFAGKIRHGSIVAAGKRLRDEIRLKTGKKVSMDDTWAEVMRRCAPVLTKHYDLALGFFRPFGFLREKVNADVKVGWVHTDYTGANSDDLLDAYNGLDYIAAVGEGPKKAFCGVVPPYADKVIVIENSLSDTLVRQQAEGDVILEMPRDGSIRLLSVGRFCEAKNFDHVPEICRRIREKGLNVTWYLIGFGQDENLIRERIKSSDMKQYVRILGQKDNPYPYMKECDFYVQPSRYEGKCVSVIEAQVLNKPVVITDYLTASEQLEDGVDGVIVPMDDEGCASGIADLLKDQEKQEMLINNTMNRDYSNREEVNKLYSLI